MRVALVTSANTQYRQLCCGLLDSLIDIGTDKNIDIHIADCGLTQEDRNFLHAKYDCTIFDVELDYGLPEALKFFKAMIVRPRIPDYVVGYDRYIWIDADAFLLNNRLISDFLDALNYNDIVGVLELSRSYTPFHIVNGEGKVTLDRAADVEKTMYEYHYELYRHFHDHDPARAAAALGVVNCGVFGARSKTKLWKNWEKTVEQLLHSKNGVFWQNPRLDFLFEQVAFNKVLRADDVAFCPFPETYNWATDKRLPAIDPQRKLLVCPDAPYEPIHLLHLMGSAKTRSFSLPVIRSDDRMGETYLDYHSVQTVIDTGKAPSNAGFIPVSEVWSKSL